MHSNSIAFIGTGATNSVVVVGALLMALSPADADAQMILFASKITRQKALAQAQLPFAETPKQLSSPESPEVELERNLAAFFSDDALPNHEALAKRVAELREELKEENDGRDIAAASLLAFHQFLLRTKVGKTPFVTLTDAGEFYATWSSGNDRLLSLMFSSPDRVTFVRFKPVGQEVERIQGGASVEQIGKSTDMMSLDWVVA